LAGNEKLAIPYHEAAEEIREMIEKGRVLQNADFEFEKDLEHSKIEYYSWTKKNEEHLLRIFATDYEAKKYKEHFTLILKRKTYLSDMVKDYRELLASKVKHLEAIVNRLNIVTDIDFDIHSDEVFEFTTDASTVLVVHGSKKIRDSVVKVLKENKMEEIILKDKKTIVDDLKQHENASHAIFIVSNEDVGAPKTKKNNLKPRAGQDVILELGYIMGKIGSEKLTVLHEKNLELPTGLKEVSSLKLTGKSWQKKLGTELQKIGDHISPEIV